MTSITNPSLASTPSGRAGLLASFFASTLLGVAACAQKTADLELDLADRAVQNAAAQRARDCAPEVQRAAEEALAEARRLAEEGDVDGAKSKASQAEALAEQARAASPPGCDEEQAAESTDPDSSGGPADPTGADAALAGRGGLVDLESALQTVYFDYNKAVIREESKEILTRVAEALRAAPSLALEIEGHCDVRGSTEYNLHLGERRARSVMKYLVTQGVDPEQIQIISYGEERPANFGFSEEAHAANRRAELKRP